jgi:hypothetical protein
VLLISALDAVDGFSTDIAMCQIAMLFVAP